MIARMWRGRVRTELTEDYVDIVEAPACREATASHLEVAPPADPPSRR